MCVCACASVCLYACVSGDPKRQHKGSHNKERQPLLLCRDRAVKELQQVFPRWGLWHDIHQGGHFYKEARFCKRKETVDRAKERKKKRWMGWSGACQEDRRCSSVQVTFLFAERRDMKRESVRERGSNEHDRTSMRSVLGRDPPPLQGLQRSCPAVFREPFTIQRLQAGHAAQHVLSPMLPQAEGVPLRDPSVCFLLSHFRRGLPPHARTQTDRKE